MLFTLSTTAQLRAQETYCFAQRDTCELYLDIFRPDSTAQTTYEGVAKPAILFVFGGGFSAGTRSDRAVRGWFHRLNDNGYTVVAIDYRLGMKGYRMGRGLGGALKALNRFVLSQQWGVEDVFAAVAYLKAHPELGVPANNLVIAGSSAGAIISLACAHDVANGQTHGLPVSFNFKGVMSFAGGVISKKGAPRFQQPPCPLLLFHGTEDRIVAYKHFGALRRGLWGSSYLAEQLKKQRCNYNIWRFSGHGHDVAGYMDVMWEQEKAFLEKNIMQRTPCIIDALVDNPSLPTWNAGGRRKTADLYQ